ncbi:hypothetical protein BC792_103207 [Sphingobacterium allocomposti]|jgi:hypothetical protein|uniref:Uncharacterized protein n=1 Tax=Sphingobacterium allocomposti TaxID=415956 RepID=A0A5S5DMV6_9SPHI|nr:hypothetical protein [Sphingobacterium composti Yoo et al. 2007 non Ten et al. 2007]TYP97280.1 hypothetical protein BC792_103207 [Sphingobacterium composti Yoo et al. 2007 non Ten et al. 2007]HLS96840.1 hypothetical protein [Sphingobacterium sp.]
MDIDLRIDKYDFHYEFRKNPSAFNWGFHPERMIIRNEGLRTRNGELYERYLKAVFPERCKDEMNDFWRILEGLKQVTGQEAKIIFDQHGLNIVKSDICWEEEDAIFVPGRVPDEEIEYLIEDEELILNRIYADWVTSRHTLWLDTSDLALERTSGLSSLTPSIS